MTCGIEKDGIALLNRILADVLGLGFERFPANPRLDNTKYAQ